MNDIDRQQESLKDDIRVWEHKDGVDFAPKLDIPLSTGRASLPEGGASSSLLVARYEVVPFFGREDLLADFEQWCLDSQELVSARILYGPGGTGKTRAMIELTKRLRERGVLAGFMDDGVTTEKFVLMMEDGRRIIAVFDYAESWPNLNNLMEAIVQKRKGGHLRVVLLARNAGVWLSNLGATSHPIAELFLPEKEHILRLEAHQESPQVIFRHAFRVFQKEVTW